MLGVPTTLCVSLACLCMEFHLRIHVVFKCMCDTYGASVVLTLRITTAFETPSSIIICGTSFRYSGISFPMRNKIMVVYTFINVIYA